MAVVISGQAECNVCPWKGEVGRKVDLAVWDLLLHKIGDHGCKFEGCTIYCTKHRPSEPEGGAR